MSVQVVHHSEVEGVVKLLQLTLAQAEICYVSTLALLKSLKIRTNYLLEVQTIKSNISRLRVSFPRKVSKKTKTRILTARFVKAKVATWMISWTVSGWRESRQELM